MTAHVRIRALTLVSMLAAAAPVSAQTCIPDRPLTKPDSRYADNGDGTVTDTVTNLTWKRCVEGQTWDGATCTGTPERLTWQQALQRAANINAGTGYAGHRDWRVPSVKELVTLYEFSCHTPAINGTMFPATPSTFWYKTSTPHAADATSTWVISFSEPYVRGAAKTDTHHVRLVRD